MTTFKLSSLARPSRSAPARVLFAGSAGRRRQGRQGRLRPGQGLRQGRLRQRQEGLRLAQGQRQGHLRRRGQGEADPGRGERRGRLQEHAEGTRARAPRDRRGQLQGRQGALRRQERQRQGRLRQGSQGRDDARPRPTPRRPRRAPRPRWTPARTSSTPTTRSRPRSATRCPATPRTPASRHGQGALRQVRTTRPLRGYGRPRLQGAAPYAASASAASCHRRQAPLEEVEPVLAPEQLAVEDVARRAEHAGFDRPLRVRLVALVHRLRLRVVEAARRQAGFREHRLQHRRVGDVALLDPDRRA